MVSDSIANSGGTEVPGKTSHELDISEKDKLEGEQYNGHSKGGMLRSAVEGHVDYELTVFERKAALVNNELDKFGFGKYQCCIWFLCGFGYFLDLSWSKGVGLAATAIYQEMNVSTDQKGLIFTCANIGLAIGAISIGIVTDIIGRKWAFNLTCLATSIFGMLLATSKYNYGAICGIYFLSSIGLGGNIPIDATIALEFMPQSKRYLVSLMSMWQPLGVVAACLLSWGTTANYRCDPDLPSCKAVDDGEACCTVKSNMGWRYLVLIIGSMTLVVFIARYFIFRFHESPKFLVSKGREQEAIDVLHKIAKFNGAPAPTLTIEDFRDIERTVNIDPAEQVEASHAKGVIKRAFKELSFLKGLFAKKLTCFTFVLLALSYMGDYWSFNLAAAFLPIILLNNNVSSGAATVSGTYLQYVYIYLPGVAGAIIALFSIQLPLIGRKWSLVIAAALQGFAMAMYTQVSSTAGYVGLNAFAYIMQTYFNAVLYSAAPEMFDTTYRASASGMLSCFGRIAGIVAPLAGQKYVDEGTAGVLWLGAGGIWFASLLLVFLPVEMRNRQMF